MTWQFMTLLALQMTHGGMKALMWWAWEVLFHALHSLLTADNSTALTAC